MCEKGKIIEQSIKAGLSTAAYGELEADVINEATERQIAEKAEANEIQMQGGEVYDTNVDTNITQV